MKSLHRIKTIAAYTAARDAIKNNNSYAAYMMLKEATRGILAYIVEDSQDRDISEKMKLHKLINNIPYGTVDEADLENISKLVDIEKQGFEAILSVPNSILVDIKRSVKKLIAVYLKEPV